MQQLKSVERHESESKKDKFKGTPGYRSGVACPKCGAELFRFVCGVDALSHYGGRKPCFCRACCHETTIA